MALAVVRYREVDGQGTEDRTILSSGFGTVTEAREDARRRAEAFGKNGYNGEQDRWWYRDGDTLYFLTVQIA